MFGDWRFGRRVIWFYLFELLEDGFFAFVDVGHFFFCVCLLVDVCAVSFWEKFW